MARTNPPFWRKISDSLVLRVLERLGISALIFVGGLMLASGKGFMEGVFEARIRRSVQPRLGEIMRRVDTLSYEVQEIKMELQKIQRGQREFFGAQMDLNPLFRAAVKMRIEKKKSLGARKRDADETLNFLLEENE